MALSAYYHHRMTMLTCLQTGFNCFQLHQSEHNHRLTHLAIWGNILSWFVFLVVYSRLWPTFNIANEMVGIDRMVYGSWVFWLGLALIPLSALSADILYKVVRKTCFRSLADEICEIDRRQQKESELGVSQYQAILSRP